MWKKCAFSLGNKCSALTKKACGRCHFYKTEEELKESRARAEARIGTLPSEKRFEITFKYNVRGEEE